MSDDLREQVRDAINDVFRDMNCRGLVPTRAASAHAADAVLAVFAGRERELRARIEALPRYTTRCRSRGTQIWVPLAALLALFDEAVRDGE